jgi:hypothetical protein
MTSMIPTDLLILARQDAVSSALARSLNVSMTGQLRRVGAIPRRLTQPPAPHAPEVTVWWE